MINVQMARDLLEESKPVKELMFKVNAECVLIEDKIRAACKEGQNFIEHDVESGLMPRLKHNLEEKGFTVDESRVGRQVRVSW